MTRDASPKQLPIAFQTERAQAGRLMPIIIVLLAPSNIIGTLFAVFWACISGRANTQYRPLVLALSLLLASVNSTKHLAGDLETYFEISMALQGIDLASVLLQFGHEPAYYLWNWLQVAVLDFGWSSWVFSFSFVIFFLFLSAVQRCVLGLRLPPVTGVCLILLAAFFPLIVAQSAHLVRQYLAGALIAMGLANFLFGGRVLPYLLLAPLFHISATLFLIIPFLSAFKLRSKLRIMLDGLILPGLLVLGLRVVAQSGFSASLPLPLQYGLQRMGQDEFHQLDQSSLLAILWAALMLVMSLAVTARGNYGFINPALRVKVDLTFTFLATLSGGVVLLAIAGEAELATRLTQYLFLLFPISLALLSRSRPIVQASVVFAGAAMPLIVMIYPTAWSYAPLMQLILFPFHFFAATGLFS